LLRHALRVLLLLIDRVSAGPRLAHEPLHLGDEAFVVEGLRQQRDVELLGELRRSLAPRNEQHRRRSIRVTLLDLDQQRTGAQPV
jgi:hypothetical protein